MKAPVRKDRGFFYALRIMKSFLKVLEKSKKHSFQQVIPLRDQPDELSEWQALQIIEKSASAMRDRLQQVLPDEMEQSVSQVKLDIQGKPVSAKLFIKAQFYEMSKREALLKVFVYQQTHKGKAVKLARAVYHLDLQHKSQVA